MRTVLWIILAGFCAFAVGCEEPEVVQPEPKRADDLLTQAEVDSFLAVVEGLPGQKLPAPLPAVLLPAPQWGRNRTLPISELVKEEEKTLRERQSIDWFMSHVPQSRFLKRALRKEQMTMEQFVGLYLALGISMSRAHLPADRDLAQVLSRGRRAIAALKKEEKTTLVDMPEEQAYYIQEQSGWLAVVDRASRLNPVHPQNLALVRQNAEQLNTIMPQEFTRNPLLEFATILDDRGVPFQEPPGQESDDRIVWSRSRALVGAGSSGDGESRETDTGR
ncbi:MAG: hypothetical protein HY290_16105 [Planctomycetia bacterium]|nr:hypothetical protein [Planctomycetia bacterium]